MRLPIFLSMSSSHWTLDPNTSNLKLDGNRLSWKLHSAFFRFATAVRIRCKVSSATREPHKPRLSSTSSSTVRTTLLLPARRTISSAQASMQDQQPALVSLKPTSRSSLRKFAVFKATYSVSVNNSIDTGRGKQSSRRCEGSTNEWTNDVGEKVTWTCGAAILRTRRKQRCRKRL